MRTLFGMTGLPNPWFVPVCNDTTHDRSPHKQTRGESLQPGLAHLPSDAAPRGAVARALHPEPWKHHILPYPPLSNGATPHPTIGRSRAIPKGPRLQSRPGRP